MEQRISVVMATCNGEAFLAEQLESIISQTRKADEIIIVDDCSEDNTVALAKTYRDRANIRVEVNPERLGPIKNFEKALRLASGDLIFFSDQDDIWSHDKIEIMSSQGGKEGCCFSDGYMIDEKGIVVKNSEIIDHHRCKSLNVKSFWYFILSNNVSGHNLMVNRSIVKDLLPFPDHVMYDQWIALIASSKSCLKYIDGRYCYHRIHGKNFVNNPELRKIPKSYRKSRNEIKFAKVKAMTHALRERSFSSERFDLLVDHVERYNTGFFSFKLFSYLLKNLKIIFPGDSSWTRINMLYKFCRQRKGLWLPSLKF